MRAGIYAGKYPDNFFFPGTASQALHGVETEPQKGSILVDGTDTRSIDPSDLRRSIGYLPQNLVLFAGTVRDNLLVGAAGADDAALLRASSIAGLDEVVNRHPRGFDMPVGERGEALSGGQRQTVAMARALVGDPPILVLDEPTHALDHSSEERLKARMQSDLADKTIIITTHQIEEIEHVITDLMFIREGRIVLQEPMERLSERFIEVRVAQEAVEAAMALKPIDSRTVLGQTIMLFDGIPREQLSRLGEPHIPALADVFVATMKGVPA